MGVLRRGLTVDGSVRHVVYYGLTLLGLLWAASCGDGTSPAAPNPIQAVANGSPSTSGVIPGQALTVEQVPSTMDVAPYFVDPDGDMLTYAAVSSDVGVMSASISGSTLALTPVGAGAAMVSVQATDPGGLTATQQIAVTVGLEESAAQSENAPDLVMGSSSVDDSSPETGGSFTLSATVSNDGDGGSAATMLRYYRSTDATITTSDTEVGTDAVGALSASGTSAESVDLTAPASAGTYYYGACVDAVTGESSTTNNCSSSAQVDVTEPPPPPRQTNPDLVVGSPSVDDSSPETGGSFTLSATVRNDGDGDAAATTLRYYRSTDATITTSDTEVGTDAVGALSASGTSAESVDLTAPASAGTYYYGACVDAVTGESSTTNNCSSSAQVDVTEPPPPPRQTNPDLVVGSPSVDDSSPETGGSFTLSATVRNDGDGDAAATTLRYYRSTDATITTSDTEVGTDAVGALSASGTSAESVDLTAPASAGTYYYGACVDAVTGESSTTNNCSSSAQVDVTEPPPPPQQTNPDLVVYGILLGTDPVHTGGLIELSAAVRNDGDGDAAATMLRYYRSTDATITTSDTEVGTDAVAALAASETSSEGVELTAPSTPGTYYYGACVDAVSGESDTTNNCSGSATVTVLASSPQEQSAPDLTIGVLVIFTSPGPWGIASFGLATDVRNDGDGDAAATTLRYYRSTDATITTSDTEEATAPVAALTAGETSNKQVDLTPPSSPGTYYYGVCVDAVSGESDTTNNCSGSIEITVP